jgi:hypothetical protein
MDGFGAASEVFDPATNTFAALQAPLFQARINRKELCLCSGAAVTALRSRGIVFES